MLSIVSKCILICQILTWQFILLMAAKSCLNFCFLKKAFFLPRSWKCNNVKQICPNCKFPICVGSDSCKNGRWHSKLECNILAGNPQLFESGEFLMFFSFLSLSENECVYQKLLSDAIFTRNFNFQSQQNLTFKFIRQLYMSFALYNCKDLTVRQKDASKDEI